MRRDHDIVAWVWLVVAVLALLVFWARAGHAQTTTTRTDRLAATQRVVIGASTFGTTSPLQVVGLPAKGAQTNCAWLDGNGNVYTGTCGTVTSVGLSAPGIFSVSGSPVTSSGTLALALATQSANQVWAGPASGVAAAPTFRSLGRTDLPSALAYEDEANTFTATQTIGDSSILTRATYASQTTGWRIDAAGGADFRYLFTDELHARSFITDLEQALAGSQIVAKSVAMVGATFTCPAAGATTTLTVRDLPSMPNAAAFQSGDWVVLRSFSRAAGTLSVSECVGQVSSYADAANGLQTWTFTRGSGGCSGAMGAGGTVAVDAVVLDYGVSGQGYAEVSAVDGAWGANSPYYQVVTWATCPVAANRSVRARVGNLSGAYGYASGSGLYGLAAGDAGGANVTVDPTNGLRLRYATANRLTLDATGLKVISPSDANTYLEAGSAYVRLVAGGFERVRVSSDGSATFTGNITSGSTITGATIQTATSGVARIVLNGTNLRTLTAADATLAEFDGTVGLRFYGGGADAPAERSITWLDADGFSLARIGYRDAVNTLRISGSGTTIQVGTGVGESSPTLLWGGSTASAPNPTAQLKFAPTLTHAGGIVFSTVNAAGPVEGWKAFKPETDDSALLGYPGYRWSNIHLSLPAASSPNYVVTAKGSGTSDLGYVIGYTGTKTAGSCTFTFVTGIVTGVSGC